MRRIGKGEVIWEGKEPGEKNRVLIYSGEDEKKIHGVGIVVKEEHRRHIEEVVQVSSRIMWVGGKKIGAIFSVYAPTNGVNEENDLEKERFYEILGEHIRFAKEKYKKVIVNGDFNARIGSWIEDEMIQPYEDIRGRFIQGRINDNGMRMMEFCVRNQLVICTSMFRKNRYGTWSHPSNQREDRERRVFHTIDYCLISKREFKGVRDCGVKWGVECWSDHEPVCMILQKDFNVERKNWHHARNNERKKRRDIDRLLFEEEKRQECGESFNRISEQNIDKDWVCFAKEIKKVEEECIPLKEKVVHHKNWFDQNRKDVRVDRN